MNSNDVFEKLVSMLFNIEGGYSNDKEDRGGATNYGITQDTFNAWRRRNNLPITDVKTGITKDEAKKIYYNMYWKESGADKYADPRDSMILFDMAVNSGPQNASKKFKESDENFYTMLDNRKKYYDEIISNDISQAKYKEGWYNRLKQLENNANQIIKENFWHPNYYNELTPFDEGYNGNLKPVGDIPDRDAKRNKYQYNKNKAIKKGIIKSNVSENFAFPRKIADMAPWEIDDMLDMYL